MNAYLSLAQSAASHADGAFSILRDGLTNIKDSLMFGGVVIVRIKRTQFDNKDHDILVTCVDSDGKTIGLRLVEKFTFGTIAWQALGAWPIAVVFPKIGAYEFRLFVDGDLADTYPFHLSSSQQEESQVPEWTPQSQPK